jgi:putative colanic acid biosynthesis acetyltransferase WcaF
MQEQQRFYPATLVSPFPFRHKLLRLAWHWAWLLLFRPSPRQLGRWRLFLLRLFGAQLSPSASVASSCRIWYPPNLRMDDFSVLGPEVECYCVHPIRVGVDAMVSQNAWLCTASHDINDPQRRLTGGPIQLERGCWVFARAFVGPGVTVGEGAIVGAMAVVTRDVPALAVVAGNPARVVKTREYRGNPA